LARQWSAPYTASLFEKPWVAYRVSMYSFLQVQH
jgi:hypothetical protein